MEVRNLKESSNVTFKCSDPKLLDEIVEELTVTQSYFEIRMDKPERFLKGDQLLSLNYLLSECSIISHDLYKLDEDHYSLRAIGLEKNLQILGLLIKESVASLSKSN